MPKEKTAEASAASAAASETTTTALAPAAEETGLEHLSLSPELRDQLSLEFQELLHQVEQGFDSLTAAGKIHKEGAPFSVIDAATISDFIDRKTGEMLTKHIFRLQYGDGRVVNVMQSDARPRAALAGLFTKARAIGLRIVAGPYKFDEKPMPGQPQAALVFTQQPGFKVIPR